LSSDIAPANRLGRGRPSTPELASADSMANVGPSNGATKRMACPQFRTAIHRRARQLPARMGSAAFHRAKAREGRRAFDSIENKARRTTCQDRKSTRLNSSHGYISYAVFCLKKKKKKSESLKHIT